MEREFNFYSTESNILEKSKEKTGTLQNRLSQQIKSKERVASRGEVFTAEREVKAMCDLVKDECERIDSRFLEPACGDGNFLAEILSRKLAVAQKQYAKSPADYEKYSIQALSSIYGIDILQDNAQTCRERHAGRLITVSLNGRATHSLQMLVKTMSALTNHLSAV